MRKKSLEVLYFFLGVRLDCNLEKQGGEKNDMKNITIYSFVSSSSCSAFFCLLSSISRCAFEIFALLAAPPFWAANNSIFSWNDNLAPSRLEDEVFRSSSSFCFILFIRGSLKNKIKSFLNFRAKNQVITYKLLELQLHLGCDLCWC